MNRSDVANTKAIVLLRIAIGVFFVVFGEYKVFGTEFTLHGGFENDVNAFLRAGSTYPFMVPVVKGSILPLAHPIAFIVAYGELLIGLSLIAGVLSRVASVFGFILMLLLWLSAGYPGPHAAFWMYWGASLDWSALAICFAALVLGRPDEHWSLRPLLTGLRSRDTNQSRQSLRS